MKIAINNVILDHIWRHPGTYRKQIATRFEVHPNLVSNVVKTLIDERWIVEQKGKHGSAGRQLAGLYLAPERMAVSASYSSNSMTCGLINAAGEVVKSNKTSHNLQKPEEIAALASRQIAKLKKNRRAIIIGAAVADPGMIENGSGVVIRSSSFPAWRNVGMGSLFKAEIGLETDVTDTIHARAAAQYRSLCNGHGSGSMLYVDYSEGRLGMTLVTPRGIWLGNGFAGEIGHVVVDPRGSICDCGGRGCLESEAGARALERSALKLLTRDVHSVLKKTNPIRAEDIFKAAEGGDRFARTVIHDVVSELCFCAAVIVAMLHPRFVVVGAESTEAMNLLAGDIRQAVNALVPSEISGTVTVTAGLPTIQLGLSGAGLMVFSRVINNRQNSRGKDCL